MKTKSLILAALVGAAGVVSSVAQSVYSANAVGYVTLTIPPGFSMIANPLNGSSTTVPSLLGSPPIGTQVYKFDAVAQGYTTVSYIGFWNPSGPANAMTLVPGEGIFIRNPASTNFTVTFVGSVPTGNLVNSVPSGYSILSSQVPQAGLLQTDLSFPAAVGDRVYLFDNVTGYSTRTYLGSFWTGGEPQVAVGQSFFSFKSASASWSRNFSVSN
jgi:hypothetical protein